MTKRVLTVALGLVAASAAIWFLSQNQEASPELDAALANSTAAMKTPSRDIAQAPAGDSLQSAKLERKIAEDLADKAGLGAAKTTLVLIAVAKESGEVLPHTKFVLHDRSPDWDMEADFPTAEGDAGGRAEFEVQPGRPFSVNAFMSVEPLSDTMHDVPPLTLGERREVRIELPTTPDLHFWCRVVRDEDSAKMPFVHADHVFPRTPSQDVVRKTLTADAEGLIDLTTFSWKESSLQVEVDGYAQAAAPVVIGYETSARAFELRLYRESRLKIEVVNPAKTPLSGLLVRASAHDYELSQSDLWSDRAEEVRSTFEATSDAAGRVVLSGLPPRVELELSVHKGEETLMRAPVKHRLDPGEEREVQLVVGGKATLAGRAIDQFDQPLKGAVLRLVKPDTSMGMVFRPNTNAFDNTFTDATGAFEFRGVAEGEWWVGPLAGQYSDELKAVAAYGQRVVIAPGAGRVEIVLHVWRGLFLSGNVRLSSGEPAPECAVLADAIDREHTGYLSTKTDAQGAFKLGPLCGVEYELRAGGAFQGDFAESKPVHAIGGKDNIVLIVEHAAKLRGTVIDAETNMPCDAAILITQANVSDGFGYGMGSETQNHAFEMTGISPGVWDVSATSRNARMATSRVSLAPGESQEITLRVAPSVTVVFKNTSPTDYFYVFPACNGLSLQVVGADSGQEQRIAVPPGRVSLRICDGQAKTITTRTIDIAPGASGEVSYP